MVRPASTEPGHSALTRVLPLGGRQIDLSTPVVMGVVNVTPDSFSDGATLGTMSNSHFQVSVDSALARAEQMVNAGADIIDVGGESTRPGADPVSVTEELQRVIPVIEAIRDKLDTAVSVDTSSPAVMTEACKCGADLINDIRALRKEGALTAAADSGAAVCLMHTLGEPKVMQQAVNYDNVVDEVMAFLKERVQTTISAGIPRGKLLVDPGFGFGKSLQHNYQLLRELRRFTSLELPILVGISRKSMIGRVVGRPADQRLAGSIAATVWALRNGADIIRTHDVAETVDVIRIHRAMAGDFN